MDDTHNDGDGEFFLSLFPPLYLYTINYYYY